MRQGIGRQVILISVLLLLACLAASCDTADSGAVETPQQRGTKHAQTGGGTLQRVTLRITGMS